MKGSIWLRLLTAVLALALAAPLGLTGTTASSEGERMQISWRTGATDESEVLQMLEEKYNVDLVGWYAIDVQAENARLMSGDAFDFGYSNNSMLYLTQQGLIREIPNSMIYENSPKLAELFDSQPFSWQVMRAMDLENGGYKTDISSTIPGYQPQVGLTYLNGFRLDWLEKLGIEAPGELIELDEGLYWCEEGYTIEQLTEILRAFTQDDPDGNGADDTFGMSGANAGPYRFYAPIMNAFGTRSINGIAYENGEALPVTITAPYKKFLSYMSDIYAKGYVDPEILTLTQDEVWEKFNLGVIGYMPIQRHYCERHYDNRPPYSTIDRDENAKVLVTGPLYGDDGLRQSVSTYVSPWSTRHYFTANVSDEKVAKVLGMIDDIVFDKETFVLALYGVEGHTYTWTGEPYDSPMETVAYANIPAEHMYLGTSNLLILPDYTAKMYTAATLLPINAFAASEAGLKLTTLDNEAVDGEGLYLEDIQLWKDANNAEYNSIYLPYRLNMIAGGDVEATWDEYVQSLYDRANLQQLIDLYAKYGNAYDFYGYSYDPTK